MHASPLTALCPAAAGTPYALPPRPRPKGHSGGGLGLSFTLPGGVRSASIARTAAAVALEAHGLAT